MKLYNTRVEDCVYQPLADRMRPKNLEQFYGQNHLVGKGKIISRCLASGRLGSCIFYGPAGTGKTTLARLIAKKLNANIVKLNAVSSGVGDAKSAIETARKDKSLLGINTYLLLDECHRWNKAQSDCVLEAIEDGSIIFIGSTTENPYTSMTRAIVSRCSIFEFKRLSESEILEVIDRALNDKDDGLGTLRISMDEEAKKYLAFACNGDARCCLNALELASTSTPFKDDKVMYITKEVISECLNKKPLSLDISEYYDYLSAFCKSLRGSDAEAALYYAQRMIKAGVDPQIIARRMIAHASEDIGMADSNALLLATCALISVKNLGYPECMLNLSHVIIYICEAEKSNSVKVAMDMAEKDAEQTRYDNVPNHLKNHPSTNSDGHGEYKYPHKYGGYCQQQYLPDSIKDHIYYTPSENGKEKNLIRKKFRGVNNVWKKM